MSQRPHHHHRSGGQGGVYYEQVQQQDISLEESRPVSYTFREPKKTRVAIVEDFSTPVVYTWLILLSLVVLGVLGVALWALLAPVNHSCTCAATNSSSVPAGGQEVPPSSSCSANTCRDAFCEQGTGLIGSDDVTGYTFDDCDSIYIVTSVFRAPSNLWSGVGVEACSFIGPTLEGLNQYRMAIYEDDGYGVPGARLGVSNTGTIQPESWNCVPMNVSLSQDQRYWIAYMSSANDCGGLNNLFYTPHIAMRSGFTDAFTWPDFPETMPSLTYFTAVYGVYLSYNATCLATV